MESHPVGPPRVTVVVVTWRAPGPLAACLDSLARQSLSHHVLVVDNAADAETRAVLAGHPEVEVLRNSRNLGFAGGADQGLRAAATEYVALLNDDATAEPDWLDRLVRTADDSPRAAAVTSLLLLGSGSAADATVNNAGVVLTASYYGADRGAGESRPAVGAPAEVFGFSGGAALLRRDAALAVGGFPRAFFLYYEDTDLSWRLRLAGWRIVYEPAAVVHHLHATSSDVRSTLFAFHNERNRLLMLARCAPTSVAAVAWARFVLTTASLAVRQVRRGREAEQHNLRVGLRCRVVASVAVRAATTARERSRIRSGRVCDPDPTLGR